MITTSRCLNNSKTSVRCLQHKEHRGLCCNSSHSEVSRLGRCRPIAQESVSSIRSSANADADTVLHGRNAGPDGLIWRGVPNQNAKLVFNNLNFEGAERHSSGQGSVTVEKEPNDEPFWRVYKPASDKRTEIRGAEGYKQKVGKTYYIGWRWRINMKAEKNAGITIFQWKSYGDFEQNYPFNMGYDGEQLSLTKFDPNWQDDRKNRITQLWQAPQTIGTWTTLIIGVKLSRKPNEGWIEIYHNGKLQKLTTGGTRVKHKTMDGSETAPKWGIYNKNAIGKDISVDLQNMCIGEQLANVKAEVAFK